MAEHTQANYRKLVDYMVEMSESINWLGSGFQANEAVDRQKLLTGYASGVQGLQLMRDGVGNPPLARVGSVQAWQTRIPPWWYRLATGNVLCVRCYRRPGGNLTATAQHDGSIEGPGPLRVRVPKEHLSNKKVCDECLSEMESQGARFERFAVWPRFVGQLWEYKGIPALLLTLATLYVALAALLTGLLK